MCVSEVCTHVIKRVSVYAGLEMDVCLWECGHPTGPVCVYVCGAFLCG